MSRLVHQWLVVELRSDGEREERLCLNELAEGEPDQTRWEPR